MKNRFIAFALATAALATPALPAAESAAAWQARHDSLVVRLHRLASSETRFGAAWAPVYHAALPWYERWGGNPQHSVDDWMSPPETYAEELAGALEQGRNFFAENPGALIPLVFTARLPDGRTLDSNYWLTLPAGFPAEGRKFPLVIGLHGSGWLGHKISFVHQARKDPAGGRAFTVTPIDEAGPWQIDFLNAYLDELLRILPIDPDRVYLEGHSLGAMATWEWATDNPERFAAISPRAGRGEPYRASRLRNIPAWVIHGEKDNVVFTGFADEMVTALEDLGGRVRYTILPGGEHNMPADLDEAQVLDWYLRQTRSHDPVPPDPRDQLGLTPDGFSPWQVVPDGAFTGWKSGAVPMADLNAWLRAAAAMFDHVHARGERVDAPVVIQADPKANQATLWLAVPKTLHPAGRAADATTTTRPAGRSIRFYFRGPTKDALAHAAQVITEAQAAGHHVHGDEVWITPLSLWFDTPGYIAEYRLHLD
ncbi:MAG TPA: hypothetical protein VG710_00190 [Opitutus sp.]|nr:hypothetical protein [Opitutus sp.]